MTKDEALNLALEALEKLEKHNRGVKITTVKTGAVAYPAQIAQEAITAIKEALAQPEYNTTSDPCLMENAQGDLERINLVQTGVGIGKPAQEPLAKVISTAPERIWLDLGFDPEVEDEISFDDLFEATWSHDNATGNGIEYVRADLAPASKPWVGLTDEEIDKLPWEPHEGNPMTFAEGLRYFARAIEAKHGIKE